MAVRWQAEAIWQAVEPTLVGFTVEILPSIDSTNTELMRRARAGLVEPVLLVAERQTAGRGRLGRTWYSDGHDRPDHLIDDPERRAPSLTFSLGLPLEPHDWSGLSLAVGLSLAKSLHPDLRLKWPNDLYFEGRKLGGILIETASLGDMRYVVIGVGINIDPRDGQGLRTTPAALTELVPGIDAPQALARLLPDLVLAIRAFEHQGFGLLRAAFHTRDWLYGKEIVCSDGSIGIARGVDAAGALLVHTETGLKKISSAEVSVRAVPPTATA